MILQHIQKKYDENIVFSDFSLEIAENSIIAILGASGCGKTTLLNIIGGLTDYSGTIKKEPGNISYLFQTQRLIPNLTVEKNIDYVLRSYLNKEERKKVIDDYLEKVGLTEYKRYYPAQLSGGMAQRVSIARAFAFDSTLLLMDEPFKGLDIALKKKIIEIFISLYEQSKRTTVFVTHDIDDALLLADRIVVLEKGGNISVDAFIDTPINKRDLSSFGDLRQKIYDAIK